MMAVQFLLSASLLAFLIYSFELPHYRKVFSSLLKVSSKKYDKLAAIAKENSELVKAIARATKEYSKSTEEEMQAYIKRSEEYRKSTEEEMQAYIKRSEEYSKSTEEEMQAYIKRNKEAGSSTRKALEELSESIERLIK